MRGDDYLCFKILKNNKLSLPPNCLHSGPVPVKAQDHCLPHLGRPHNRAQILWLDRAWMHRISLISPVVICNSSRLWRKDLQR